MEIFDTLRGKKIKFKPIKQGKIGMYVCGPTVYDFGHLGHGRSATAFDVIRRYFIYKGFEMNFVTNYTDVDDKMINRAEIMKISVSELAAKVIPEYKKDYEDLGIMEGDNEPKATKYIEEMIDMIKVLEEKGYVYKISDGVYFDIRRFGGYGKLSKQKLDELRAGARKEVNPEKRNHQDFVVWKFSKPGEPKWDSPWGEGRPGWHIECSAMCKKLLGETFDIHCGGADLIFPHHECEIALSEACNGVKFTKYWLHNGFIRIDDEKMSKSLGNFFTLRDIFKKYDPQVVRYLFLQTHYRSPIDFTDNLLEQSVAGLMRVHDFMRRLDEYDLDGKRDMKDYLKGAREKFEEAMDDDFETPVALAVCFDLIKEVNKAIDAKDLSASGKKAVLAFIDRVDSVMGIFISTTLAEIDSGVEVLIKEREKVRADKDWKRSDEIRDELLKQGIQLEDTSKGTVWKKV